MSKKPEILSIKSIANSRLFNVESVHLRFSNGEERQFERIHGRAKGAVMVVPMLDDETVLLVREYAAGLDEYWIGFPKGALDHDGLSKEQTANRELMEEVGYGARQIKWLTRFSASPGYMSSMMDVYVARDLFPRREVGDEAEPLEVIEWKLKDIDQLLAHPEFHEARSIAALLLLVRMS